MLLSFIVLFHTNHSIMVSNDNFGFFVCRINHFYLRLCSFVMIWLRMKLHLLLKFDIFCLVYSWKTVIYDLYVQYLQCITSFLGKNKSFEIFAPISTKKFFLNLKIFKNILTPLGLRGGEISPSPVHDSMLMVLWIANLGKICQEILDLSMKSR